jgi:predicted nucleotidyltransferase
MTVTPPLTSAQATGLPDAALTAIRQVLASHPEVEAAILYGSLARIDADLDDLLLPWMIDLSCHASIHHPALLAHIERAGLVLYRRRDAPD